MINAHVWRTAVAALFSCLLLIACENDVAEIDALTNDREMVDEALKVETLLTQGGRIKAKLTSPVMYRHYRDTIFTEFPQTLHVDFYGDSTSIDSNQVTTTVDAKYGKYFESLNKVYLRDSVRVISSKGDTLLSPDLWWDQNAEKFYTDKAGVYLTPTRQMYFKKGLDAAQDLSWYTSHVISGGILVDDNDPGF